MQSTSSQMTKPKLWSKLKSLYHEFNVSDKLKYQTATKTSIKNEIERIETTYEDLIRVDEMQKDASMGELIFDIKSNDSAFPLRENETVDELKTRYKEKRVYPFFENIKFGSTLKTTSNFVDVDTLKRISLQPNALLMMKINRGGVEVSIPLRSLDQIVDTMSKIEAGYDQLDIEEVGSDNDAVIDLVRYGGTVEFKWIEVKSNLQAGAYFPYFNNTTLQLHRYQIFNRDDRLYDESPCLIYALEQYGIDKNLITQLKIAQVAKYTKLSDLKSIAKIIGYNISVKKDSVHKESFYSGGENATETINLGMLEGHFFLNELMLLSKQGLRNLVEKLKLQDKKKRITSFETINYLIKHADIALTPITIESIRNAPEEHLNYSEEYSELRAPLSSECNILEAKTPKEWYHKCSKYTKECNCEDSIDENVDVYFIDTETTSESGVHKALVLVAQKWGSAIQRTFVGKNCVKKFLYTLTKKTIIYAHNLAFDFSQFISDMWTLDNLIQTGSMVKQCTGRFNKLDIVFKDSYSFLAIKLSDFSSTMNLTKCAKEAYPYTLLNSSTISQIVPINLVLKHVDLELHKQLIMNATDADCLHQNGLDLQKYTIHYCKQDVRILHDGFLKFHTQVIEATGLDIRNYVSLPQLANSYQTNEGCFEGCYSFSGLAHQFMRKAIVGGRVLLRDNEKQHVVANGYQRSSPIKSTGNYTILEPGKRIDDCDAVSLYPSAMRRLAYPMGIPSLINYAYTKDSKSLSHLDYYIVEIKITKVGIKRHMPLLSIVDKSGIRNYTNEVVGRTFVVDKITLEDLEEFQGMEYEIIQGYQWTDGKNDRISEVIKYMFDQRIVEKKKQGGGLQLIWKLLMNASYGKLIQKPITSTKTFVNIKKSPEFVEKNFKFIKEMTKVSQDKYLVTMTKSKLSHFACPHLGGLVLSMSKRIMNEVICLAEDNDLPVYYQDTDSMHIQDDHVDILRTKFSEKYGREIIGKNMGQFHGDFDIPGGSNVKSVEFIAVGKKVYADRLEYTDREEMIKEGYHIRVKGIPSKALKDYSAKHHDSIMHTYDIFKNTSRTIKFDLSKYCVLTRDKSLRYRNSIDLERPPTRTVGF